MSTYRDDFNENNSGVGDVCSVEEMREEIS